MTTAPMTLSDLLDWHARRLGWERSPDGIWAKAEWGDDCVRAIRAGCLPSLGHPINETLDAIADLLPPGWTWTCSDRWWFAFPPANPKVTLGVTVKRTGDEKRDRALLAKLAREEEEATK